MNRSTKSRKTEPHRSFVSHCLPIVPDREQGAWIAYQLKLQGFTLESIAGCAGVSGAMIHMVIYGKKTSARVQKIIALSLCYDSWNELLAAREGVAA